MDFSVRKSCVFVSSFAHMDQKTDLVVRLRRIGFRCIRCGSCCREISPGSNIVMISPEEIQRISLVSGRIPAGIADPFPDTIKYSDGLCVTFEWCLKRSEGTCVFADGVRCTVYQNRPWICSTFPFMLNGKELTVSDCPGIGHAMDEATSLQLAGDLIRRALKETEETEKIQRLLENEKIPEGDLVVIDGEGFSIVKSRNRW